MSTAKKKRKSRAMDRDILALKATCRGLDKCTSRRMVRATLNFCLDRYIANPSKDLPVHLQS